MSIVKDDNHAKVAILLMKVLVMLLAANSCITARDPGNRCDDRDSLTTSVINIDKLIRSQESCAKEYSKLLTAYINVNPSDLNSRDSLLRIKSLMNYMIFGGVTKVPSELYNPSVIQLILESGDSQAQYLLLIVASTDNSYKSAVLKIINDHNCTPSISNKWSVNTCFEELFIKDTGRTEANSPFLAMIDGSRPMKIDFIQELPLITYLAMSSSNKIECASRYLALTQNSRSSFDMTALDLVALYLFGLDSFPKSE
jgi:hypothetical protein